MVDDLYKTTIKLVEDRRDLVEKMALALLDKEGSMVDVKGSMVDVKGSMVDVQGSMVDVQGSM
eukprot:2332306-Pyramimonas_sp.AAC.1